MRWGQSGHGSRENVPFLLFPVIEDIPVAGRHKTTAQNWLIEGPGFLVRSDQKNTSIFLGLPLARVTDSAPSMAQQVGHETGESTIPQPHHLPSQRCKAHRMSDHPNVRRQHYIGRDRAPHELHAIQFLQMALPVELPEHLLTCSLERASRRRIPRDKLLRPADREYAELPQIDFG